MRRAGDRNYGGYNDSTSIWPKLVIIGLIIYFAWAYLSSLFNRSAPISVSTNLKFEKNKDGQVLKTIEIYLNDNIASVDLDIVETTKGHGFWYGLACLFLSASNLEDVIIYDEEAGGNIPCGYVTIAFITISTKDKKNVVRILARNNLVKPYLHGINIYGDIKAINTSPLAKSVVGAINVKGDFGSINNNGKT